MVMDISVYFSETMNVRTSHKTPTKEIKKKLIKPPYFHTPFPQQEVLETEKMKKYIKRSLWFQVKKKNICPSTHKKTISTGSLLNKRIK